MSTRIPESARKEIFAYTFTKADEAHYLEISRPESGQFMENLRNDPKVGGRLEKYMEPARVRTYIKDTLLNKYAKDKKVLPRDVEKFLCPIYGELDEIEYRQQDHVSLHRVKNNGSFVGVSRASDLKWETGLRKLVQYVAALPTSYITTASGLLAGNTDSLDLVLIIFEYGSPKNESDKRLTEKGLKLVNVQCLWA